jgi:phosphoribosylanthranilate isomerase
VRTRIKICGITRIDDGAAAARAGADAIGLVFWPGSPRCVPFDAARAIAEAVPPFVSVVGLFVDPDPAQVHAALAAVPLSLLQFHGTETAELCRSFARPYIKAVPVSRNDANAGLLECIARHSEAAGFLFDAPPSDGMPGGTGQSFDRNLVPRGIARPVILSGGLDPANVREAIRVVRPWAVDVSSGVELRQADGTAHKGIKDPARIAAFIEEVRNADG